ncbi:MAG: hypothetical protein P1U40_08840 [Coxiellaceae bacterium]|nr:hypothetical protein [Coxiellaceae bacterium]
MLRETHARQQKNAIKYILPAKNTIKYFSKNELIFFIALGLLGQLLSDIPSTAGIIFYVIHFAVIFFLLLSVIVFPIKKAALFVLFFSALGQDIVSDSSTKIVDYATSSVWQVSIGPLNPSWQIFILLIIMLFRLHKVHLPRIVWLNLIFFLSIPVIAGGIYADYSYSGLLGEVVKDIKFPAMLIISITFFYSLVKHDKAYITKLLLVFIIALFFRHATDLLYYMLNIGPMLGRASRGSVDSAKSCIVLLFYLGTIVSVVCKRYFLGGAAQCVILILVVGYGTRMIWLLALLGAIVLFYMLGVRGVVRFLTVFGLSCFIALSAVALIKPASAQITLARLNTITKGRDLRKVSLIAGNNHLARIDPGRYGELLNILHDSLGRMSLLWGSGYGGYYKDSVIHFPRFLKSAFPDRYYVVGQFYSAHNFFLLVFLKFGLVGVVLISLLWLHPAYRSYLIFKRQVRIFDKQHDIYYIMLFALVPFIFTSMNALYWSAKGLFISGFIIAVLNAFVEEETKYQAANVRGL